jgi:hypothetical protein
MRRSTVAADPITGAQNGQAEDLIRHAAESRTAKPHSRPCRQQLDQELPRPTSKARHTIIGERRTVQGIGCHHAHGRRGCIHDSTAIDRNPEAPREVTKHRGLATRSDHSARRRLRPKAMRDQPLASPHATHPVLSPQDHRRSAGDIDNGSDRRSGVKYPAGRAAARTMADHSHHRWAGGL